MQKCFGKCVIIFAVLFGAAGDLTHFNLLFSPHSPFTEKPCLQLLALAQTLARRIVRDDLETCSDNPYQTHYTMKTEATCPDCQKHVQILSLSSLWLSRIYFFNTKSTLDLFIVYQNDETL